MVRVFTCHHFTRQDIISLESSPRALVCHEDKLFVATSHSQIQVYDISGTTQRLLAQFHTLGNVINLLYNSIEGAIATLEENNDDDSSISVRVYLGWENAVMGRPVRVNIAGHMTSLRQDVKSLTDNDNKNTPSQVQVVEIPLKGRPRTFALNPFSGHLMLAVGKHVLIYGLCCKTVALTKQIYRDMKCLLDLEFTFTIRHVALYDNFIVCSSFRQCQVVRLNNDTQGVTPTPINTPTVEMNANINETDPSRLDRFLSWVDGTDINHTMYIQDDDNLVEWDFMDDIIPMYSRLVKPQYQLTKDIYVSSIHGVNNGHTQEELTPTVLFHPKDRRRMVRVSVEYEDACCCGDKPVGLVDRGTTCHLTSTLPLHDGLAFIAPLLLPLYKYTGTLEANQTSLEGMCCMLSTGQEARLYLLYSNHGNSNNLGNNNNHGKTSPRLMAVYPFTADIKQLSVSGSLLYAMSANVLEIYTCHYNIPTPTSRPQHLYSVGNESCMLGLEAFMNLTSMVQSSTQLVLLSQTADNGSPENCWSVYKLQKPTILQLHDDIKEVSSSYQYSNTPWYQQLLHEDYYLLLSHVVTRGTTEQLSNLLQRAALALGLYYARHGSSKGDVCMDYLEKSGYSAVSILCEYLNTPLMSAPDSPECPSSGLVRYLDRGILHDDVHLEPEDVDMVVSFYSSWSPARLLYIMFTGLIHTEKAMECLSNLAVQKWRNKRLTSLFRLNQAMIGFTNGTTYSELQLIDKVHLSAMLMLVPECLLENWSRLTTLGLAVRTDHPDVLVDVLENTAQQQPQHSHCVLALIHTNLNDGNSKIIQP